MTKEQIEILKLGIAPIDDRTILIVESALEWVQHNTTLEFDINNDEDLKALPSCVRLFIIKYFSFSLLQNGTWFVIFTESKKKIHYLNNESRTVVIGIHTSARQPVIDVSSYSSK